MKLYQFYYSPYAAKVRKCLDLKRIPFEIVEVPYMDRREVVRLSNQVVTPVLADGATVVADSPRITAYLDEKYPHTLRPTAAAGVFEAWADSTFEDVAFRLAAPLVEKTMREQREDAGAMYRYVKERKFGAGCLAAWTAAAPALLAQLRALLAPLVRTLEAQPFLLGETPTLADAAMWGQFYMLETTAPGFIARETPELARWYGRLA